MLEGLGDRLKRVRSGEKKTVELEQRIREDLENPSDLKRDIQLLYTGFEELEDEFDILESSDLMGSHEQVIDEARQYIDSETRARMDTDRLVEICWNWHQALESTVENPSEERVRECFSVASSVDNLISEMVNGDVAKGEELVSNIDTVIEVLERLEENSERAESLLQQVESAAEVTLDDVETEAESVQQEIGRVDQLLDALRQLKQMKDDRESEMEDELDEDLGSEIESLQNLKQDIESLLEKFPKAIFSTQIERNGAMNRLESMYTTWEKLETVSDSLGDLEQGMGRRDFLKFWGAGLSVSAYLVGLYKNIKAIDEGGGGHEIFFSPDKMMHAADRSSIKKAIRGEKIPVQIIHVVYSDESPSYDQQQFCKKIRNIFRSDLGIKLEPKFYRIDLRNDYITGSLNREKMIRMASQSTVSGGLDEKFNSSPASSRSLEREFLSDLEAFKGFKLVNDSIRVIISNFDAETADGTVVNTESGGAAVVQEYNQPLTVGITIHEIGHKFSLPHVTQPHGIMSYGVPKDIASVLGKHTFSWESKYNWWKFKDSIS